MKKTVARACFFSFVCTLLQEVKRLKDRLIVGQSHLVQEVWKLLKEKKGLWASFCSFLMSYVVLCCVVLIFKRYAKQESSAGSEVRTSKEGGYREISKQHTHKKH